MADQVQPPEDWARKPGEQLTNPRPCLTTLPAELHFRIVSLALAAGQERDVSALARTSKLMHCMINYELHRLVVKHKMFFLLHWAARWNQLGTLKLALEYGANPNQMRTSDFSRLSKRSGWGFRPLGWNLTASTDHELNAAMRRKYGFMANQGQVWFTSTTSLSTTTSAQFRLLMNHYVQYRTPIPRLPLDNKSAKLLELSEPLDEDFAFPQNMSPVDMNGRDVKIRFVRLFQYWDTPLHVAAALDRASVAETLLANGGDMDCTATEVCSCLRRAATSSAGYALGGNSQDIFTYTPLHVAICVGSYGVAKVLVASGAERMARILRSNGAREWLEENALHTALSWRPGVLFDYDFVEFLLKQGYAARIEERNFEGMTPLQIACQGVYEPEREPSRRDVLGLLIRYGADPNSQCLMPPAGRVLMISRHPSIRRDDMATIGLWATRLGNFRGAKLLLDHGADASARSSTMHETMLFALCKASDVWPSPNDTHDRYWRSRLLDDLLARGTAKDLNTFYGKDQNLLMRVIGVRMFETIPQSHTGEWESKVFTAGADIMAGADMGQTTPFELMITAALSQPFNWIVDSTPGRTYIPNLCSKILVILRASGIKNHRFRPGAMLNRFWGLLKRHSQHIGIAIFVLPALLGAGFSPAEVDSHGDTAMTSFLQHLLDNPLWATTDSNTFFYQGWILPTIMAMLQEHDAALDNRNNKGFTASDYVRQIIDYKGSEEGLILLRNFMRRSVRISQDGHRDSFKFHPTAVVGLIDGYDTVARLLNDQSRWLTCKHLCERGYCSIPGGRNWRSGCTTHPTPPTAMCEGDCCPLRARDSLSRQDFF
ncbi:hypothetical protein KVR01_012969 [Diaporthe batatas]|uniref:uncharacterized protein n=1 Tax=Diaporthe batatas TaxID=748121 RepID=UPI001D03EBD0|nr:uncharacterized protein KVR01_012969 [Diaporthe batatas]KAG8157261.1 hypothetical protein KVR01_012969 [Diaporthe batatas]